MDNIAIACTGLCIFTILFLVSYLHDKQSHKIKKLTNAGYPIRKVTGIASGFGDGIEYEFFIDNQWFDTETAFKKLNSPNP